MLIHPHRWGTHGIQVDQDVNCRTIGRCTFGGRLDREVGDLVPRQARQGITSDEELDAPPVPLSKNLGRRFLYVRYDADLSDAGLKSLGIQNVDASSIQRLDAVENI